MVQSGLKYKGSSNYWDTFRVPRKEAVNKLLTDKREKYVQNLLAGMSQRKAYRAAFGAEKMSDKTVDVKACRLLADAKVKARYEALQAEARKAGEATAVASAVKVLEELTNIATGSKTYATTDMYGNEHQRAPTVTARIKALELLAKYHGLLTDRVQVNGTAVVQIVDDLGDGG